MNKDFITQEELDSIKKELLQVLRKYELKSGIAIVALDETKEHIEKYSSIPE